MMMVTVIEVVTFYYLLYRKRNAKNAKNVLFARIVIVLIVPLKIAVRNLVLIVRYAVKLNVPIVAFVIFAKRIMIAQAIVLPVRIVLLVVKLAKLKV